MDSLFDYFAAGKREKMIFFWLFARERENDSLFGYLGEREQKKGDYFFKNFWMERPFV